MTPRPAPQVAALAPYPLAPPGTGAAAPVSLAQNESASPPSPRALAAARAALAGARLYPDPDWTELRQAIAAAHGVDPTLLLCGAGSMELMLALARAYLAPGDRVAMPAYGYLYFRTAAALAGAAVDLAPEAGYRVDADALVAAVRPETRMVFLADPANPTGTRIGPAAIAALRAALPRDVLLVIDEAYGEFVPDAATALPLVAGGATVVLRSFSKAYGLAGLRAGWGLFPPAVAAETRKALAPNSPSAPAQAAAAAALQDRAAMRATVAAIAARRDRFASRLRAAGYLVPESTTNFVLIDFTTAAAATAADAALRARGLALRRLEAYGLVQCLRATIGAAADMDQAAEVLEQCAASNADPAR